MCDDSNNLKHCLLLTTCGEAGFSRTVFSFQRNEIANCDALPWAPGPL